MKLFILLFSIFALIGIMDLVKFHWEESIFSKVVKPDWLKRWLNPHERFISTTSVIMNGILAPLNDFWHMLKMILVLLIIWIGWLVWNEGQWWVLAYLIFGK
jgi:hypothetical protein